MSKDENTSKKASTAPSKPSETSMDTNPEAGPSVLQHGSTPKEFAEALVNTLSQQKERWALAKLIVRNSDGSLPEDPDVYLLDSENHFIGGMLNAYEIRAYVKDKIVLEDPRYRHHDALALPLRVPVEMVIGFKWMNEEETYKYIDIHKMEYLN